MTSAAPRVEYPHEGGTEPQPRRGAWRSYLVPLAFIGPAAVFLLVYLVYPALYTMWRSLFSDRGGDFVGLDNYETMFRDDVILTAIKNNFLWVLIVPALVTAVGLIFAVLTEKIRWAVAFKIVVFMPLAVSLFAVGVIWRIMYQDDPERGVVNAAIVGVQDVFSDAGAFSRAQPSTDALSGNSNSQIVLEDPVRPGDVALLGLTAVPNDELPEDPPDARRPEPLSGGIAGVVWRDFGGENPGQVESGEVGLAGVRVQLRSDGSVVESTTTEEDGTFAFEEVDDGEYTLGIAPSTFAQPFNGFNWLGPSLITPAIMFSYIWVTAGFAMVIIAAGLAAIPRDVLEAARTDGGSEWQIFRRVTVPLLAPVLTVVFVTQIIGVLKIFDLILAVAPGSSQDDATVIAFEMWQRAFSGQNRFGLGSAIATFLFLLFVPFLVLNIKRFRSEAR